MSLDWVPIVTAAIGGLAAVLTSAGARRAAKSALSQDSAAVEKLIAARGVERSAYIAEAAEVRAIGSGAPAQNVHEARPEQRLLDALEKRSEARFQIQSAHYANALKQSTTYFYLSAAVGLLGFVLIITGTALALGKAVEIGTATGVAGLLGEAASALVFTQSNRAKSDAQNNLTAIAHAAERDENRQMALIYASKVEDRELRDATNAELARQYLALLNGTDPPAGLPSPRTPRLSSAGRAEREQGPGL
ncbi:TRADD-N-associated membrane domain-containing protein [Mycobacterium marseillense]|uniref:TRADD-N-associated membrane domain-containing protein n=1 Tax=Mycobacterium marseillense TaxID=701042 RepID=UPI0012FE095E|nr:hypothetical protein [Mycobacterium marseillense]